LKSDAEVICMPAKFQKYFLWLKFSQLGNALN
jgi:hypothetical protein